MIWIAQCLCPQRHAVLAAYGEAENAAGAEEAVGQPLREQMDRLLRTGALNRWCGLCKAPADQWRHEVSLTTHRSLAEAHSPTRESERQQAIRPV